MRRPYVHELFLRQRFPGWRVPGVAIHLGRRCFVERENDGIDIPQHAVTVLAGEHDAWLRTGHDPGDEDSLER